MQDSRNDTEQGGRKLTRRGLFLGTGAAALLAAGCALFQRFSSTSSVKVESFSTPASGQKKRILIITGSGRENGNSDILAAAFARGAREAGHSVELFSSARTPMLACMHCEKCWSTGRPCVIEDNFEKLWPLLERTDLLVFCSPLYWYNFSGHIKCVMDRLYPYSKKEKLRDLPIKESMLLMCGESHFLRSFTGPAEAYRQTLGFKGWKDRGRLFVTGVHKLGDMAGHPALATAEDMGRNA